MGEYNMENISEIPQIVEHSFLQLDFTP